MFFTASIFFFVQFIFFLTQDKVPGLQKLQKRRPAGMTITPADLRPKNYIVAIQN